MGRWKMRTKGWGWWARMVTLGLSAALAVFAGLHGLGDQERQELRAQAAQQLAMPAPGTGSAPAAPSSSPTSSPTASSAPSQKVSGATSIGASSTMPAASSTMPPTPVGTPASAGFQPTALPPQHFTWAAAGLSIDIAPMQWNATQVVDPPLDANGFDPLGHWLVGTGESAAVRPVVLAGHTCHQEVALCTDATFPFNRLSYSGWAVGQPASLTEANGNIVSCALADRRIVDKSKAFSFANDPCQVVLFSCNYDNPDAQIVLVTFRCGQCT